MDDDSIQVVNMRSFFSREIFMHSLGDIRFSKPIALKRVAYTALFLAIYTAPLIIIFGFIVNVWFVTIAFVPPFVLGTYANKPIWGGRTLIDFIKVTINFIKEPRGWTDHKSNNELGKGVYSLDSDVWVSRRREIQLLKDLKMERKKGIPSGHKIYEPDDPKWGTVQGEAI